MAFGKTKPDKKGKENANAKYGLNPSQELPYEKVPKDGKGNPLIIVDRTNITYEGEQHKVDIYNDEEAGRGVIILPNGSRAYIDDESYKKVMANFERRIDEAKRGAAEIAKGGALDEGKTKEEKKKARKMITEAQSTIEYRNDNKKKMVALVVYVAAVILILFCARTIINHQQNTVDIIRVKTDLLSGDVITEDDIEKFTMLESTYNDLGMSTYVSDGKNVTKQTMIKWDEREKVLDKYVTCYTQAGQYLTDRHITSETVTRNPWLAVANPGQEVYTLAFSASDVNTSLLYPGCHMRVRLIVRMDEESYLQYTASKNGTPAEAAGPEDILNDIVGDVEEVEGVNVINSDVITENSAEIPVVEVVFEDMTAIDMLNSSNQSIYELYMALLKLPLNERVEYLNTTIKNNEEANNFRSVVTPTRLVFLLDKEQADMLAQFESLSNATFKYTILLTDDEDDNLVTSFVDISNQLQNVLDTESAN